MCPSFNVKGGILSEKDRIRAIIRESRIHVKKNRIFVRAFGFERLW